MPQHQSVFALKEAFPRPGNTMLGENIEASILSVSRASGSVLPLSMVLSANHFLSLFLSFPM